MRVAINDVRPVESVFEESLLHFRSDSLEKGTKVDKDADNIAKCGFPLLDNARNAIQVIQMRVWMVTGAPAI